MEICNDFSFQVYEEGEENIGRFVESLSMNEPQTARSGEEFPVACLIVAGGEKEVKDAFYEMFKKFGTRFAILVKSGAGTYLYHHLLPKEKFSLESGVEGKVNKRGMHHFHGVGASSIISYLKNNGGAEKFPRIVVVCTGKKESFTTPGSGCWHFTDIYLGAGAEVEKGILDILEEAHRDYGDGISPTTYCTRKTSELLEEWKAERVRKEVERIEKREGERIKREKTERERKKKTRDRMKEKLDREREGEERVAEMEKAMEKEKKRIDSERAEKKSERVDNDEVDREEAERLTGLFPRWKIQTSNIAKFVRGLEPEKKYTEGEMREYCRRGRVRLSDVQQSAREKKSRRVRYGDILRGPEGGNYFLNPMLAESFRESFSS